MKFLFIVLTQFGYCKFMRPVQLVFEDSFLKQMGGRNLTQVHLETCDGGYCRMMCGMASYASVLFF